MLVRLAALATENEGYDRALGLLSRAQSLGPFHAVPELVVVSLVSSTQVGSCMLMISDMRMEI